MFLSSSGGVWLKTRAAGLLFWKSGHLTTFSDRRCTPALQMEGIAEDRDGSLWLQASGGLFHMRGSTCEQIGAEHGYPGGFPAAILVDREGTVWVRTLEGALLYMSPGQSAFKRMAYDAGTTSAAFVLATATHNTYLHEAPDGSIWLSDDHGLRRVINPDRTPVAKVSRKERKENVQFGDFTFTGDGSIWAVSDKGLRRFDHVDQWPTSQATVSAPGMSLTTKQGLSSDAVWKVLIDREGSVWVGTNSGLDRLRRTALSTIALPPAQEHDFSILAGDQGSFWTGNLSLPLTHVAANGHFTSFPKIRGTICLRVDRNGTIWSAVGGDSTLWHSSGAGFTPMHYPEDEMGPVISLAVDRNNELWLSTASGGAYHFMQGSWRNQNKALGKKPGILGTMTGDEAGKCLVWLLQLRGPVGRKYLPSILFSQRCARRLGIYNVGPRGPRLARWIRRGRTVQQGPFLPGGLEKPGLARQDLRRGRNRGWRPLDERILRYHPCLCRGVNTVASRPELPGLRRTAGCGGWTSRRSPQKESPSPRSPNRATAGCGLPPPGASPGLIRRRCTRVATAAAPGTDLLHHLQREDLLRLRRSDASRA